ncbi:hypothetical protein U6N30_28845 [Blastococcus brunescens]|uniref:FtsX-like permease family protein n=1 Tax=Blastococcus brunescens TaxID=1564165 RepID=A0ABZ1AZR7_9ACTN|nr:hypothetical protein [Blastococcus sp. BMG 8361]WRL63632.1 hypothetical protein U6N30_28845 [Blastococcus sp. BMG 8361]
MRTSWRLPVGGLAAAVAGLVVIALGATGGEFGVAIGAVLLVLGVVLATPWLVGLLAPLARWLPTSLRLALRDATRNRTRTASAIAAVMATVAGVTALGIGSASDSAQARRDYVPQAPMGAAVVSVFQSGTSGWDAVERIAAEQVPGRPVGRVQTVASTQEETRSLWPARADCAGGLPECSWFPDDGPWIMPTFGGEVVVVDPAAAVAATADPWRGQVRTALAEGRAVVFGEGAVDAAGELTVVGTVWDGSTDVVLGRTRLPATEVAISSTADLRVPALVVVPRCWPTGCRFPWRPRRC